MKKTEQCEALRKAARQALEALEWAWGGEPLATMEQQAITALREALAEQAEQEPVMITPGGGAFPFAVVGELEQAEQEPVAWWCCVPGQDPVLLFDEPSDERYPPNYKEPLYAAPVRTKDLTDDEIAQAVGSPLDEVYLADFRAVIAADRVKNNLCERTK